MEKRVHVIIKGRVQGIFFRDFVEKRAFLYQIKGFVRNLSDGESIELVAEGDEVYLRKFLEECQKGPHLAVIEEFDVKEEEPTGEFKSFSIRY